MNKESKAFVNAAEVPGVVVMNGKAYGQAGGRWFPMVGILRRGGYIPVLNIPQIEELTGRKAAEV